MCSSFGIRNFVWILFATSALAQTGEIRGTVVDARGGEALSNVSNRKNYYFDSFNGYNTRTGQANIRLDTMFPILPSAGFVFER